MCLLNRILCTSNTHTARAEAIWMENDFAKSERERAYRFNGIELPKTPRFERNRDFVIESTRVVCCCCWVASIRQHRITIHLNMNDEQGQGQHPNYTVPYCKTIYRETNIAVVYCLIRSSHIYFYCIYTQFDIKTWLQDSRQQRLRTTSQRFNENETSSVAEMNAQQIIVTK